MGVELGHIASEEIEWGRKTHIEETILHLDREELISKTWGGYPRITFIKAENAKPGESIRQRK
jgi:hypothetical protein